MDFNEYRKLSQVERNNLETTTTDAEELATLEELKQQFEIEMKNEIEAFKTDNEKVDQIIESVNLENPETVDKVKAEIGLDVKLKEMDSEAEKLLEVENKEVDKEKIIKKLEDLFNKIDLTELEEADSKTKNSGFDSDHRVREFELFKKDLIEKIKDPTRWFSRVMPNFKELISQNAFQDIALFIAGNFPDVFLGHEGNQRLNTLIESRPEFLESKEIESIYKYQIIKGIKEREMFEGYRSKEPFINSTVQSQHVDFFEELTFKYDTVIKFRPETDDFGRSIKERGLTDSFWTEPEKKTKANTNS